MPGALNLHYSPGEFQTVWTRFQRSQFAGTESFSSAIRDSVSRLPESPTSGREGERSADDVIVGVCVLIGLNGAADQLQRASQSSVYPSKPCQAQIGSGDRCRTRHQTWLMRPVRELRLLSPQSVFGRIRTCNRLFRKEEPYPLGYEHILLFLVLDHFSKPGTTLLAHLKRSISILAVRI